jgi:hypothetical protein
LWVKSLADEWSVLPLEGGEIDLCTSPPRSRRTGQEGGDEREDGDMPAGVALLRASGLSEDVWVVVVAASATVRVNGQAVAAGMRALEDRDEIKVERLDDVFFSTETLVSVAPAPASERPLICARCRRVVVEGDPAVCCPGCGVWHHQTESEEEFPCWTHGERCAACDVRPTDLGAGYDWSPEEL